MNTDQIARNTENTRTKQQVQNDWRNTETPRENNKEQNDASRTLSAWVVHQRVSKACVFACFVGLLFCSTSVRSTATDMADTIWIYKANTSGTMIILARVLPNIAIISHVLLCSAPVGLLLRR